MRQFLDTTVVTDALLKRGTSLGDSAALAFEGPAESTISDYVAREFRLGPLQYAIWLHNKFCLTPRLDAVLSSIRAVLSRQPYRASLALELLGISSREFSNSFSGLLAGADLDTAQADSIRLSLQRKIHKSWRIVRSKRFRVEPELSCDVENSAELTSEGILRFARSTCRPYCRLAPILQKRSVECRRIIDVIDVQLPKSENARRRKALKALQNPRLFNPKQCRDLGDAAIVLLCPPDARLLTTNLKDFDPLCTALKVVCSAPVAK